MLDYTGQTFTQFLFWTWTSAESGAAPEPEIVVSVNASGGWESYFRYEQETLKRKRELQKHLEEEEARIQDEIDREIAQLLHQQDRQAQEKSDLARLQTLVNQYASQIESDVNAERVTNALKAAQARMTLASFERLAREINRAQEEEEFMFFLALIAEL